ncbi:MAG: AAA family ATPase [Isosphaeraceae bacterium]
MTIEELIAGLARPEAYQPRPDQVEVRQSHISVVFLAGPVVYKIKKPLRLSYLDYSTLERRRHFCVEEVRLNRRLAPQVYLGVVPVTRNGDSLMMEGSGEIVEWAVKMRRLADDATLRATLDRDAVGHGLIEELGRRIAAFHAHAERGQRIADLCRFDNVARLVRENLCESVVHVGQTIRERVFQRLTELTEHALEALRPEIESRLERGLPCDTHGDLRLDHVYVFPNRPPPEDVVIIDGIEFNETFRAGDPVVDMAFLVMELVANDHRELAEVFRNAYVSASGDFHSARLLRFYVAYRAMVRGKVNGVKATEIEIPEADRARAHGRAQRHWLVALGALEAPGDRPCLVLVGGLPGTGKTRLARELAAEAHFQRIRSDQVRKELAEAEGEAIGPRGFEDGIYSPEWTDRTYQTCQDRAERELFEGRRVVVDATFGREAWRQSFLQLARRLGVPGILLLCEASPSVVKSRLDARRHDLSDADWTVHQQAARQWEPPGPESCREMHRINTAGSPDPAVAGALEILRKLELQDEPQMMS